MKIIFLDIDGVLNCPATLERFQGTIAIDTNMVSSMKRIIRETGAKVVISSTWRMSKERLAEIEKHGIEFIDITPVLRSIRGEEIASWLKSHPNVKKYAILDDDSDFLPEQPLFQTSWEVGLTEEIANKVIKYLRKK